MATFGILAAALVTPTIAQASTAVATVTLAGTYTLVHVDGTAAHPGASSYHQELLAGGRAYNVQLRSGVSFRSGDTVQLSGHLDGTTMKADKTSITAFAPDAPAIGGTTRVLVILAQWTQPDSTTQASAAAVFAADNTWFNQTSYGHLSLSTTVTNWVHVSAPATGLCTDSSVSDQLTNRALVAAGYSASSFDRVVVYFPSSTDGGCSNVAGFAEAPGSRVWLNGTMDARSSIHEQGHNYGLYHAHAATCTTPGTTIATAGPDVGADNCTYSDYGDPYDAMGASSYVAEYSAGQKNDLGWLDAGRKATLTAGATVTLAPYEQQSSDVHAAVYAASSVRSYWFENRTASGPDARLPSGATAGVLVHVTDTRVDSAAGEASSWAPTQSYLLDQTPAATDDGAVLPYGQTWTSPEGITFSIGSPTGDTVTVSAAADGSGSSAGGDNPPAVIPPVAQAADLTLHLPAGQHSLTINQGAAVTVSGTALRPDGSSADGAMIELQTTPHGRGSWTTIDSSSVSGLGSFSAALHPGGTSDYRLHVASSGTELGSDSNLVTVIVRPVVIAAVSKPRIVHGATVGLNVSIPGHAGQLVSVQRWSRNAWHPYTTVRLGTNGKRSVAVRPAAKGQYRYRFVKPADAYHLAGSSKALQVKVL